MTPRYVCFKIQLEFGILFMLDDHSEHLLITDKAGDLEGGGRETGKRL